ncbi:MAG: hypothetical protein JWQ21_2400 [Herminiimonas sp.]|nr:hypothetical protein [Herminiimonas sp.]
MKSVLLIFTVVCSALASGVSAAGKNFDFPVEKFANRPATCAFNMQRLPPDTVVYAAEAYSGRKVEFQIDQSGHQATQIDVAVNSKGRPVALILGAYEPTIWNIGWTPGSRIVAILARGYHRQAIAGVDSNVPVIISTYDNKGPCGHFSLSSNKLESANPLSRKLFGRPVDAVIPVAEGYAVAGAPIPHNTKLITSSDTPPSSYADKNASLAGAAGIDDALRKGLLRKATKGDVEAWVKATGGSGAGRQTSPASRQGAAGPRIPSIDNAYVVLKKFSYPAGLYGADSVTFFIQKGAPRPDGNPGHSSVYDFNTLVCAGPGCS